MIYCTQLFESKLSITMADAPDLVASDGPGRTIYRANNPA
jgi:hypothetical protein